MITIYGDPVCQERHRVSKWGGMYDPSSKDKKAFGMLLYSECAGVKPSIPEGDIYLNVTFFIRAKKYGRKPDIDNFLKGFMDSANRILWTDDSQVTRITACLMRESDNPRTEFEIHGIN